MKIKIKTKLILLFSFLMAVVLSLQYYFLSATQKEVLAELQKISESINEATRLFFFETGGPPPHFHMPGMKNGPKTIRIEEDSLLVIVNADTSVTVKRIKNSNSYGFKRQGKGFVNIHRAPGHRGGLTGVFSTTPKDTDIYWYDINISRKSNGKYGSTVTVETFSSPPPPPPRNPPFTVMLPGFAGDKKPRFFRYKYDLNHLTEVMKKSGNKNLLILLGLFILSFGGIFLIARSVEKPILDLQKGFGSLANGEEEVKVTVKSNDEMGELAAAFNRMSAELQKNRNKEKLLNRKERFAAIGQLAAGVAHEIKNPLNAINLTISHLKDLYVDRNDKRVLKYIETISGEIQRLDKTVNDFLNYTRNEKLNKKDTDINALINQITALYEREMKHGKITLEIHLDSPFVTRIDPERMQTALVNILLNAIQATPEGGKIIISANPSQKTVQISDTGKGIPENQLENIFDLYYTTKSGGTGLGLPIAWKIVRAHGGNLEIKNNPDKGVTVTIRLENTPRPDQAEGEISA